MKLPHKVTLFNHFEDIQTGRTYYLVTIIDGVLFRLLQAEHKTTQGKINGNNAKLFIPITAQTQNKTYISPAEFKKNTAEENATHFTFSPEDFFVLGEHSEYVGTYVKTADVEEDNETYRINMAEFLDFGSISLKHWEIVCV